MQKLIVGNWKMHGDAASAHALALNIADAADKTAGAEVVVCPPAILLSQVATALIGSTVKLGGQDCHTEAEGAFTGDISAAMLKSAGCAYVIVGHSERRQHHYEDNNIVRRKAEAAIAFGLIPIICIGETAEDRNRSKGEAAAVVNAQLRESLPKTAKSGNFILAYEPVWAIGSGQTPTTKDIEEMHSYIKGISSKITEIPSDNIGVIYGGSVKAANAAEILAIPGVSGVLVGGASVKAEEFCKIIDESIIR